MLQMFRSRADKEKGLTTLCRMGFYYPMTMNNTLIMSMVFVSLLFLLFQLFFFFAQLKQFSSWKNNHPESKGQKRVTLFLIIKLCKAPLSLKTPLDKAYDTENSPADILYEPQASSPSNSFWSLERCLKYQRTTSHWEITNSKSDSINLHKITPKRQTINSLLSQPVSSKICSRWQVIALCGVFSNHVFIVHIVHIPTRSKKLRSSWKLRSFHTKRFCKNLDVVALTKLISSHGNVEFKIHILV